MILEISLLQLGEKLNGKTSTTHLDLAIPSSFPHICLHGATSRPPKPRVEGSRVLNGLRVWPWQRPRPCSPSSAGRSAEASARTLVPKVARPWLCLFLGSPRVATCGFPSRQERYQPKRLNQEGATKTVMRFGHVWMPFGTGHKQTFPALTV